MVEIFPEPLDFTPDSSTESFLNRWIGDVYILSDVILPFIVFFSSIYLALIGLGWKEKRVNATLSFVISAMVVIPHILNIYPEGKDPVILLNRMMLMFAIIIAVFLILILRMGLFGKESKDIFSENTGLVVLTLFCVFTYIFYPELFPFVLVLCTMKLIQSVVAPGKGYTSFLIVVLIAMLFIYRYAFGIPDTLPQYLEFLTDPKLQSAVIIIYFFLIVTTIIFRKKDESK